MEDLIERLKRKDETALKQVMAMYKNSIFNYLYLLLGDREMAREVAQDTFVKVYFKAGSLRTDNLKSWIYAIATNAARTQIRKARIRSAFSLSEVSQVDLSYNPGLEKSVELEQVLSALPEKYRIALVMKDIDNFSFEEIAKILKKPIGTVKTLVSRGRQRMRFHLQSPLENSMEGSHG